MAKMMFDNLNAIVADTLTESIKMIDIGELHESEDNFFDVNRVEEFAETILGQGGVKDNLVVRPLETGGYEIISGHRRRAAVQYLLDNGENVSRYLPCLVQSYNDDDSRMLDIVLMNVSARQISDSELWKSYEIVDRILKSKKSAGEKFGRVREKLAECLGVSPAQVGKMQNVEKYAIPAVKEAVENGEISISTANEIAKLDEEIQEQLAESDLSNVKHKEVKKISENTAWVQEESENEKLQVQPNNKKPTAAPVEQKVDTNINFSKIDNDDYTEKSEDAKEKIEESLTTEKELLKWAQSLSKEQISYLLEGGCYNNAIKGYLITAAKNADIDKERIYELLDELNAAFSDYTKDEAEQVLILFSGK